MTWPQTDYISDPCDSSYWFRYALSLSGLVRHELPRQQLQSAATKTENTEAVKSRRRTEEFDGVGLRPLRSPWRWAALYRRHSKTRNPMTFTNNLLGRHHIQIIHESVNCTRLRWCFHLIAHEEHRQRSEGNESNSSLSLMETTREQRCSEVDQLQPEANERRFPREPSYIFIHLLLFWPWT